jgi:osmotically-inducible protein OsmY
MKPDYLLLQDVRDELRWEPALQGAQIRVAVAGGTVTLTGQVGSLAARAMAETTPSTGTAIFPTTPSG